MGDGMKEYVARKIALALSPSRVKGVWYGTHGTPAKPFPYKWFPKSFEDYKSAVKCMVTIISLQPPSGVEVEGAWWIQI